MRGWAVLRLHHPVGQERQGQRAGRYPERGPFRPQGPVVGLGVGVTFIQRSAVAVAAVLAVVAVVAAGLAATGGPRTVSAVVPSSGPPPSPAPPPPPARSVLLTTSNDGETVHAAVGELVVVRLVGRGAMRWSAIRVSQSDTVLVRSSASLSRNGASMAAYRVTDNGEARLSSAGTPICAPDMVCPQFIVLWQASVIVTP